MWDACLKKGTRFFNHGRYHEAGEAWECHWLHMEQSNEKTYLQGMIKVAAAYDKYVRGEHGGTAKLLQRAIALLEETGAVDISFDRDIFLKDVKKSYSEFMSSGTLHDKDFPEIAVVVKGDV